MNIEEIKTGDMLLHYGNKVKVIYVGRHVVLVRNTSATYGDLGEHLVPPSLLHACPTPLEDLTAAIEKLMQGVTKDNAVERTKEKYELCKAYGESTGDWSYKPSCPICAVFDESDDCPLRYCCGGGCIKEFHAHHQKPSRDTFMPLYEKIMELGKDGKVEVKPGQVWEPKERVKRHKVIVVQKSAGFEGTHWSCIGLPWFQDMCNSTKYLVENYTLLPEHEVVVIGPKQTIIDCPQDCVVVKKSYIEEFQRLQSKMMQPEPDVVIGNPEPTLSLEYVRENACGAWGDWFDKQTIVHSDDKRKTTVKGILKAISTCDSLPITGRNTVQVALEWLIKHGLIDESLQITGVSK